MPARSASSRSPNPARLTVARSSAAGASPGSASRGPASLTSASSATLRPISARNHGAIPVAPPMTASGTPRRIRPRIRHSRLSDGSRNRRRTIGAAARWAWRVEFARLARLVDPGDRLVGVGVARVDAGQVAHRRAPGVVLGQRPDAGLLETAERLVECRPECPVDGHHLAGRLHLAAERPVGAGELVEREARQLDHDVVERRFEGRHGRAGDHVRDLGEPPPDRDLGRDPGDRVAGRLGGQRGRARDARVDLDDRVLGRVGRERELDVAAALDAERADDLERGAAQALVNGIGQGLDRRDDDRVAGVDAERVDVLHRADGDARVIGVAHHLVLDLLPADEALLDHDLADRAGPQARRGSARGTRVRSRRCRRRCHRA